MPSLIPSFLRYRSDALNGRSDALNGPSPVFVNCGSSCDKQVSYGIGAVGGLGVITPVPLGVGGIMRSTHKVGVFVDPLARPLLNRVAG